MHLLILGGTIFLGRHLAEAALARGHRLTLFQRGRSNPGLFPGAETLRGERTSDLTALLGRRWDAVIDTSGYLPAQVQASTTLLAGAVAHYTFISSISVYADLSRPGVDEAAPLVRLPPGAAENILTPDTYGPLKALCEDAVAAAFPNRSLIVRPGLIAGPHDPTGRFTYWAVRLARGGLVLAPGPPETPVQWIDVRDLAAWLLDAVEAGRTGVYNAVGPAEPATFGAFLAAVQAATGSRATLTWLPAEFLLTNGVSPWVGLPLWIPPGQGADGFHQVAGSRARAAGLTFRPLADTARDTLVWVETATERGAPPPVAGLAPDREAALLRAWSAKRCR